MRLALLEDRYRFLVVIVTFLCLISVYSNGFIISVAYICMDDDSSSGGSTRNETAVKKEGKYSNADTTVLLVAYAIGTLIATIPVNVLANRIGARETFTAFGMLSAVSTALIPPASSAGLVPLLVLRLIQGISFAANYVTIGRVGTDWSPLKETATFLGILTYYTVASSMISSPITTQFCMTLGWQWSFYAHAIVCALLFSAWFVLYRDRPAKCPLVSPKELALINEDKDAAQYGKKDVPYRKICKNLAVLVIWLSMFFELCVAALLHYYNSTFFYYVLGISKGTAGILIGVLGFAQLITRLIFSVSSDKISCISERKKLLAFNTIAYVCCGVFVILIGFSPWTWLSVLSFGGVYCCISANCGSSYKMAVLVSRQHSHFVVSMMQLGKSFALFTPSIILIFLESKSDIDGWRIVFSIYGCILIMSHFAFAYACTTEPASFTRESGENEDPFKGEANKCPSIPSKHPENVALDRLTYKL